MLKSKVGYNINKDPFIAGLEAAKDSTKDFNDVKINFIFTNESSEIKKLIKGVQSSTTTPLIGCTSSNGIIIPDGYINNEEDTSYAGIMSINDSNMNVGVACHEAGRNARVIGRKVAIEAVKNAGTTRAPAYFYMVASPKEEEDYLMGIQDVIGRVPMFGGSAADNNVEGNWKIICNDKVFTDGVAVAFFYTDNEIVTSFTGAYKETKNLGIITSVKNNRTLVTIDGVSALKKYAHWTNVSPNSLKGNKLLEASILKPLGIKDPLGNLIVVRHPMFGDDQGTRTTSDDTIKLGNKVVEGTAIIQLECTTEELIKSVPSTIKEVKNQIYNDIGCYLLIHCGGRKLGIGERIDEVHKQILKETKGVPFIMPFTFGEYGYGEHSANTCGGLMLSFTAFGKN